MSMAQHFLDHFMDELAAFRLQSLARGNQPLPFAQQRLELFERRAQHVRRRCDQQIVGIANGGGEIGTRVQLDRKMRWEERRVGKECGRKVRYRWSQFNEE